MLNRRAKKEQQRKDREKAIENENKRLTKRDTEVEKLLASATKNHDKAMAKAKKEKAAGNEDV